MRRLGGVAVVHARLLLTGQTAPDGSIAGRRNTLVTAVLEKRPAGWLCVAFQNTDIVPGAETQLSGASGLGPADYR